MTATLELYDGSTTIDLLGGAYNATLPLEFGAPPATAVYAGPMLRGVTRAPRSISVRLVVKGTSVGDLRTRLRDLEGMLASAEARQTSGYGAPVTLRCQLSNTDSDDIEYRVMWGALEMPTSALDEPTLSAAFAVPGAVLHLVCEPMGRLAAVSVTPDTLENEQDGAAVNYMDFQGVAGTVSAPMQLKVHDPNNGGGGAWSGSRKMWIARRSGERRADGLFLQGQGEAGFSQGTNPGGVNTTFKTNGALAAGSASGGQVAQFEWSQDFGSQGLTVLWTDAGYVRYQIAGGAVPEGLYRALARVQAASDVSGVAAANMGFALGWSSGARSRTPVQGDEAHPAALGVFETLDLGELTLGATAVPDGFTAPPLDLRVYGTYHDGGASNTMGAGQYLRWRTDYLFLLPVDEGAVIVDAVSSSDRVLIDSMSDDPGVYLLDRSDEVQRFASFTGGPFDLGPEDTRVYVLRDDSGDP